jgi:hypothetical protein
MNQLNEKDIIRHYLLNLLTIINIEISNFSINKKNKEKIDNLINVASILIANEDIFLNNNSNLFIQEVSLKELIDFNCEILSLNRSQNNISLKKPENDLIIQVDKFHFSEALKYLLKETIKDATEVEFMIDNSKNTLIIKTNKKNDFQKPVDNLINFLKTKNFNKDDITFQLANSILKIHNISVKFNNNEILMRFRNTKI